MQFSLKGEYHLLGGEILVDAFLEKEWINVFKTHISDLEINIRFDTQEKVKYIRISFSKPLKIGLSDLKIITRDFRGLIVASRSDGFGCRVLAMMNAMYFQEHSNLKFGFVWEDSEYDEKSIKNRDGNQIFGLHTSSEAYVFDPDFIQRYSYTGVLPERSYVKQVTLKQMQTTLEYPWGSYTSHLTAQIVNRRLKNTQYLKKYKNYWENIGFSQDLKKVMLQANEVAKRFDNGFITINMRSGDIVYDERPHLASFNKACPSEIIIDLIDKALRNKEEVILFSDDLTGIRKIRDLYKKSVHIVDDFIDHRLQGVDRIVYEIVLMSHGKEIYAGESTLARIASYIGLGKEVSFYYDIFSLQEQYDIVLKNLFKADLHPRQKAYSPWFLYITGSKIDKDQQELFDHISQCIKYDDNPSYYPYVLLHYLRFNFMDKIDSLSDKIILDDHFCSDIVYGPFYEEFYNLIYKYKNTSIFLSKCLKELNQYIIYKSSRRKMPWEILKDELIDEDFIRYSAKIRIKNQLSYKLGAIMIHDSKSILSIFKLPFDLIKCGKEHKNKSKNKTLASLPPLETYSDYKEALKIKEHLSYKLGEAWIKAYKNWYKGGFIKFIFIDVPRIKREFQKAKK
ncbi:hypothetical protein DMB92_08950 [Campylobacter sp. MIT 99-7217]|nr:hypothetical protein DMB92_08950 [Campylobacter sp. MIT 99-7217]